MAREARRLFSRTPDWLMDEVTETDGYGFDVRRCVMAEYMESRGEREFCRDVVCKQDLLMAQRRGDALTRTRILATGGDRCDFRFLASQSAKSPADVA